ncbi:MAG: hypothetical protein R2761_06725 [Acidimicrobiales bacterium]
MGLAQGLALALDEEEGDTHALLALIYSGFLGGLIGGDGVDAVLNSLRADGVPVPTAAPPQVENAPSISTRVYYPSSDGAAVTDELVRRFPPPASPFWGVNRSLWKAGFDWVDADDACGAGEIVRSVATEVDLVQEIPLTEAIGHETAARTDA